MPQLVVFGHNRSVEMMDSVLIGGVHYPVGPTTALSRMFFRVSDVSGNSRDEDTGVPVRKDRFYEDPTAYYMAVAPPPTPPTEDPENGNPASFAGQMSKYHEDVAEWKKEMSAFDARHDDFYRTREHIVADPRAYIDACVKASTG